jgi:methionyl aminopeptidase
MMFTKIKTPEEILLMRESGKILAHVLSYLSSKAEAGMSTKDLADLAKQELKATGGQPTFLGYQGFPDVLCVSVNDEVVHGIPRRSKIIKSGDLVSLDFGVTYQGMITDGAITTIVGQAKSKEATRLVNVTRDSLMGAIKVIHDGVRVGDISNAVQGILDEAGYGIVRDLVGHGVGHDLHEDPNIPNYGKKGAGPQLFSGMTIAVEPMATMGSHEIRVNEDNWTVRTDDGSLSAHFEHTILITDTGAEVLTKV